MRNSQYLLIFVLNCMFFSSCSNPHINVGRTILFEREKLSDVCGTGFEVSDKREPDRFFRKELERYLYKAFIDEKNCDSISMELFKRKSFAGVIFEIYTDSSFLNYSIYDYKDRWREAYINLLRFCTDDDIFYTLCDSLLLENIDDGLIAVWDKDARKLNNLQWFADQNKGNYYQQAQIVAIYHNSNMIEERDLAIKNLIMISKGGNNSFLELLKEGERIDYSVFMESVYGGM